MGLFDFFKRKTKKPEEQHEKVNVPRSGVAFSEKIDTDNHIRCQLLDLKNERQISL